MNPNLSPTTPFIEQLEQFKQLESHEQQGLTETQIEKSRLEFGSNLFEAQKDPTLFQKIGHHLLEIMNLILLAVGALSAYLAFIGDGNYTKTAVVGLIVIINLAMSVYQESRAENALTALKELSSPTSTVTRDGRRQVIASSDLVVGDIIHLSAGNSVGADVRLLSANSLQVDEASLTGESEPVDKDANAVVAPEAALGDQLNLVFSGTNILNGTATGVVVAIGARSQMGQIATLLEAQVKGKTPLQKRIDTLAKRLSIVAFAAGALIFAVNTFTANTPLITNLMTAVVLGIAAVPETLPVIVTLSLIYGVENMAHKRAIIRNIPAVETLGNATVIASDKTGTLTQNRMTIQKLWTHGHTIWSQGALSVDEITLLNYFALASNATIELSADGNHQMHGDPTETAILRFLTDHQLYQPEKFPQRLHELPFDSERKRMTVVLPYENRYLVLTKGAFDRLITATAKSQAPEHLSLPFKNLFSPKAETKAGTSLQTEENEIHAVHDSFAQKALRVLALSYKIIDSLPTNDWASLEEGQIFLGMIGMIDPPRTESYTAVNDARTAGIKPIMITGDHALTAKAIAQELDIYREGDKVMTGQELSALTDSELSADVEKISVYARVSPEDKLRIVKVWQDKGQIVAMTGDGVNDAPSLRAADVGTAMGITGTEVAKSASDIILADDNFATIVRAVREGRRVYANIKKTIYYLLSANVAEILTMLIGAIVGWGLPFTGMQLLYINVLADGIPGFGLSREKADDHIMARPPIGTNESLFSQGVSRNIAIASAAFILTSLIGFASGAIFTIGGLAPSHQLGQTMAFVVLTLASTINVYNARSNDSIFKAGLTSNTMIFATTLLSLAITLTFTQVPVLMSLLDLVPMSATHWLIAISLALTTVATIEITKLILARLGKKFIG